MTKQNKKFTFLTSNNSKKNTLQQNNAYAFTTIAEKRRERITKHHQHLKNT